MKLESQSGIFSPRSGASGEVAITVLHVERVDKSFGPVAVLKGVSLNVSSGEVHAVIGENGAGKSTLMKVLSGEYSPTAGRITLDGTPIRFADPAEAERHGIVLVPQELLLAPDLTIAQNLFLGHEIRRGPFVDDTAMRIATAERLADVGAALDPETPVRDLSIGNRQLVQIAKALLRPHRFVIFDEPTASLTPVEAEALFRVIGALKARDVGVIYISHRLVEVKAIADRVSVLRDGEMVASRETREVDTLDMARLMVGRDMADLYPERHAAAFTNPVLEARGIVVPGYVTEASFTLRAGEILGFAGLIGAGRTELLEGVLGLRHRSAGTVLVDGKPESFATVADSMRVGIVYLSEDRKGKGLLLGQSLRVNLTLAALKRFCTGPVIDVGREKRALAEASVAFDIRAKRDDVAAGLLSGGNQQKLLIAKMMALDPRIVVIDEPTRGIDIGTKADIYALIARLARDGKSVVVISSEMQELIGLCGRILVMREGRIVGEVDGRTATEDDIVVLATGAHEAYAETIEERP